VGLLAIDTAVHIFGGRGRLAFDTAVHVFEGRGRLAFETAVHIFGGEAASPLTVQCVFEGGASST
jgi:hypothetical protein